MRRVELIACVALAGCMKIYPDPELPDAEVTWYEGDCREEAGDVVIALIGIDDSSLRLEQSAACTVGKVTFVDIPRERYRIEGALKAINGDVFSTAEGELDLRNGWDVETSLYFGQFDNFRAAWTFEAGHSCASLDVYEVFIELSKPGDKAAYGTSEYCQFGALTAEMPPGTYTARALAYSAGEEDGVLVAVSPPGAELTIERFGFTDAGTLVLAPCGTQCE